jgi:hypothetical protein
MVVLLASAVVLVVLALTACVAAFPEQLGRPIPRWRLVASPLLLVAATLGLLYLPPNDLGNPQLWMVGLVAGVLGVIRGALVGLQVDQRQPKLLLRRAPEGFWIAVAATLLILADVVAKPFGHVGSVYVQSVELVLMVLAGFLVGRNLALAVRSRDTPHRDL